MINSNKIKEIAQIITDDPDIFSEEELTSKQRQNIAAMIKEVES